MYRTIIAAALWYHDGCSLEYVIRRLHSFWPVKRRMKRLVRLVSSTNLLKRPRKSPFSLFLRTFVIVIAGFTIPTTASRGARVFNCSWFTTPIDEVNFIIQNYSQQCHITPSYPCCCRSSKASNASTSSRFAVLHPDPAIQLFKLCECKPVGPRANHSALHP
ncbi:hypothetical protein L207DRAFT_21818 [Hyaloscypha variabilis F]|uniref:Uncharacterized protein n=1 Tax=Hyaloscypha variabilis (strain UAMH 11265 / GT02V1 / F) TaxID=1149755 RepID=A0A2J6RLN9_HYAVF|nr:hypothetical protein L207DRAFT_21818 [Hyaloscypha variabilis F]